jgi:replicative DNA helicase
MAITANTKILTLDYWKLASKIEVGDYVFDQTGNIVQVKMAQAYQGIQCYEIMFNDYLTVTGDAMLSLPVETAKYRNRLCSYKSKLQFRRPLKPFTAEELRDTPLLDKRNRKTISVPTAHPLQLPHKDLPVPPFLFGLWFFARRSTGRLAAAPGTSDFVHEKFRDHGYKVIPGSLLATGERDFSIEPSISRQLIPNTPKNIPNNYLLAAPEQRQELLSGIMCAKSRQYNKKRDTFRFSSKNYDTTRRVQLLAESIGCKTQLISDAHKKDYTVFFKSRLPLIPNQSSPPVKIQYGRRYVTKISPIPAQLCIHIETTAPDNTILVGEGFIPTC